MLLKSIKLAGFKSFVDPTHFHIKSSLTGIVGPNGCGKSNVVDAIRWVIGEISAKQLRGESMTDVIFNGTISRKPVGQASIELTFDNSDGTIGGQYAGYSEISVRREVNRDAQSTYSLNGTRCRRKDILDVFYGTGLGPRSYAIIEQGMITRLIEAKPEDLRVHLEEVAGIAKYKERRRETENRIRHTRENLDRLNDLREEISKQLNHLQRQAEAAEHYKVLKQEERLLRAQLQALHWENLNQQISEQESLVRDSETRLDAKIAEQRGIDLDIEKLRQQASDQNDVVNEIQKRYYSLGADIARIEGEIANHQNRQQQLNLDLEQIENSWQEAEQQLSDDQNQLAELKQDAGGLEPQVIHAKEDAKQAQQQLLEAEEKFSDWQLRWDEFNHKAAEASKQAEVERTRIEHLEHQIHHNLNRTQKLKEELEEIDFDNLNKEIVNASQVNDELKNAITSLKAQLEEYHQQLRKQQDTNQLLQTELNQLQEAHHQAQAKRASLQVLQEAALGKDDATINQWLAQEQLTHCPRLAEGVTVAAGWEQAVELVLGPYLEAICIDNIQALNQSLDRLTQGQLTLLDISRANRAPARQSDPNRTTLQSKVQSRWPLASLLDRVYVAETFEEATQMADSLAEDEMIVTRGGICLGPAWLRVSRHKDKQEGILARKQLLEELAKKITEIKSNIEHKRTQLEQGKQELVALENAREEQQQTIQTKVADQSEVNGRLSALTARVEQLQQRQRQLNQDIVDCERQVQQDKQVLAEAGTARERAFQQTQSDAKLRQQLIQERDTYRFGVEKAREEVREKQQVADELQVRLETTQSQLHYLQQSIKRSEKLRANLKERRVALTEALDRNQEPLPHLNQELEQSLEKRLSVDNELQQARQALETIEHDLHEHETQRTARDEESSQLRSELEQIRMHWQELKVRISTHQEQIAEMGYELDNLRQELPENANLTGWTTQLEKVERRVQRLGAINLAAIDECKQLEERKTYLDQQNEDLMEALATLENAIHKIDKQTRECFRETFDKVNQAFGELFPKIFGGGRANLELTDNDLLSTGIVVRAQPPGKRNTTIHLLSGGEKALTAIALVFALFQLNPAPFCILDEVDAPLDDANVARFCGLVKEMSDKVQFIVITHNKVTMEMANQLVGVTMNEPGVSRLVSVDIEEAMALAEQDEGEVAQQAAA